MNLNIVFALCTTICKMLAVLTFFAILSNSVSGNDYAIIVSALFISQLTSIIIDGGINSEILSVSEHNSGAFADAFVISNAIRAFLYLLVSTLIFLYNAIFNGFHDAILYSLAFLSGSVSLIIETYSTKMKISLEYKRDLLFTLIISLVLIFTSLMIGLSPFFIYLSLVFPRLVSILLYKESRKIFNVIFSIKWSDVISSYSKRKYYSIDAASSSINLQLDSLFLLILFGKETYSLYQPLNKLYQSCISLSSAVTSYAIPRAHKLSSKKEKFMILFWVFLSFSLLISVGYFLFSKIVVSIFFGKAFSVDFNIILALALLLLLRYLSASFGCFLMIVGQQKLRSKANLLLTLLCLPFLLFTNSYFEILCVVITGQFALLIVYMWMVRLEVSRT
ncbi:hypothetical protein ACK4A3_00600 [Aeromonas veronii]